MSELQILGLVAPIIIPVLIGWMIVRVGWLNASVDQDLSWLFLHVCAPPLIIVLLAKQDLARLIDLRFILATLILFTLLYGGILVIHRYLLKRPLGAAAMAAFAGTKFNTVIVGLPVLLATVEHHAIVPTIINLVAGYFTILPLTLVCANAAAAGGESKQSFVVILVVSLQKAITHPLVVATLIGMLLAWFHLRLPHWLEETLMTFGNAAILLALIAVGMSLDAAGIRSKGREIAWMSAVRIIVSPILAIVLALALELQPVFAIALVISFSLPTAKMVLPLARGHGLYAEQAAGIITVTTASLPLSWPAVIWICEHLWPGVIAAHG